MSRVPRLLREFALHTGVARLVLRLRPARPVILRYLGVTHHAAGGVRNGDGRHVQAEQFDAHVALLKGCRRIVPLATLVEDLAAGRRVDDAAVITFDVGYENNASVAAPILARHGAVASFFLSTGYVGESRWTWADMLEAAFARTDFTEVPVPWRDAPFRLASTGDRLAAYRAVREHLKALPAIRCEALAREIVESLGVELGPPEGDDRFMSWDQARALAEAGHEVGAHTVNHPILSRVPFDIAEQEILGSRDRITRELGRCSDVFAYPDGRPEDVTPAVVRLCQRHFRAAVSGTRGWAKPDELFGLRRLPLRGGAVPEPLEWTLLRDA